MAAPPGSPTKVSAPPSPAPPRFEEVFVQQTDESRNKKQVPVMRLQGVGWAKGATSQRLTSIRSSLESTEYVSSNFTT